MAGVCSSGCYLVAWRQDEGRWLPVGAFASGSVLVSGWRQASVLVKEHAARNLWDRGHAEPGRCSQTPDSERDTAEPLEHVLGHHSVELQSRLRRKKERYGLREGKLSILRVFQRSIFQYHNIMTVTDNRWTGKLTGISTCRGFS